MECVLRIREKSGSKEKSGYNQHVAITKAIHIFEDAGAHAGIRCVCLVLAYMLGDPRMD